MKSTDHSATDVSALTIERDLRTLWEQMAEVTEAEHREPVMRACVLNLMVYAPGENAADQVSQIMADVTTEHPSRIFVILPNHDTPVAALNAWVTAQCHLAPGGRKQVCCEQIMITAEGGALHWLPSLVRPLLVPDLPVVLWWRDRPETAGRLFDELLETADRVIIDAGALHDPLKELGGLTALIKQKTRWAAFSDLSWARLTPWRGLVAGFFDVPDYRPYLTRFNRVEIECRMDCADHDVIPVQALLIVGWLASRLRWQLRSGIGWIDKRTCQLQMRVDERPIVVQIKTAASTKESLNAIRLSAEGEPSARFMVSKSEDGLHLLSNIELAEKSVVGKVRRLDDHSQARLISRELEILDHDAVYEQALEFISGLQDPDQ
ncbi:MAG: glucose-6-phosphate dehydrogenase assembly protein OpcA [Candidatus Methylomirabilales bacterium]